MHWFQCCPPGWVTCIATLPGIALLTLSVGIDLVSSSARVTSVKFQKHDLLSDRHPDPKIGPQVYLGPIKRWSKLKICTFIISTSVICRMTPSSLHSDLVDNWFPGNATVQSLFLSSDARSFLNTFNQSLPADHMRVLSAAMSSAQVILRPMII